MMKKKSQVLITSFTTIALCTALISGSTLALFTSEAKTNIAITSGKVNVTTTVDGLKGYSAEWDSKSGAYTYPEVKEAGKFTNGGTFEYDAGTLSLTNITPGDGVEFTLKTTNGSNVAIQYQVVVTDASEDPEKALYRALKISVGEDENMQDITSDRTTAVSDWEAVEAGGIIPDITVSVKLPVETTDDLQGKQCDLLVSVYAVQGNGHDETNQNVYLVSKDSNLTEVLENLQDGDILSFTEDIEQSGELSVEGKEVTADLGGHALTLDVGGSIVADMGASLTLTGGKISVDEANRDQEVDSFIAAYNDEGTTTTLNIDCEIDLDNVHEAAGRGYFGIWAEGKTPEEGGKEGSRAVINITDHTNIHRALADGSAIGVGANAEVNMTGGKIEVTASENSRSRSWVASAVWLEDPGACFNLSGGEIIANGYNVAAINLWGNNTKFCMTGGSITIDIDVTVNLTGDPTSSAMEVYDGEVEITGGFIEVKSNIAAEGAAKACGIYASTGEKVTFGKDAKIIVHKGGTGGSENNFSVLTYSDVPVYDESGASGTLLESMKEKITNWTLEGTVELVRE